MINSFFGDNDSEDEGHDLGSDDDFELDLNNSEWEYESYTADGEAMESHHLAQASLQLRKLTGKHESVPELNRTSLMLN